MKDYAVLDSFKDRMDSTIDDAFEEGYKQGYEDGKADTPFTDTEEAEKKAYDRGLSDAWELVKRIESTPEDGGLTNKQIVEVFGQYWSSFELYMAFSVGEAMYLMKAYEDKQKQDAEIKVGDEVYSDAFNDKGIVTHITTDKVSCVCIICNGFTMMRVGLCGLHKTGRHFDQIAEVLAELRGAENDE